MSSETENVLSLDWLHAFTDEYPVMAKRRQSIYQIARFPDRELVLSNLLAFYLDPDEDHGFGALFFNSLVELIEEEESDQQEFHREALEGSSFRIHREWYVKDAAKRGYIDLVITGDVEGSDHEGYGTPEQAWAILIENKLHASLYNDLDLYNRAKDISDRRIGVVLAMEKYDKEKGLTDGWVSITHRELMDRVRTNLGDHFDAADDRHLLLLKEFFLNMDRHHMEPEHDTYLKQLEVLRRHQGAIARLDEARDRVNRYIGTVLDAAFERHGFVTRSRQTYTRWRTYYPDAKRYGRSDAELEGIRIWVPAHALVDSGSLHGNFELYGEAHTVHGPALRDKIDEQDLERASLKRGESGKAGGGNYHLAWFKADLPAGKVLPEALEEILGKGVFADKQAFVRKVLEAYARVKKP